MALADDDPVTSDRAGFAGNRALLRAATSDLRGRISDLKRAQAGIVHVARQLSERHVAALVDAQTGAEALISALEENVGTITHKEWIGRSAEVRSHVQRWEALHVVVQEHSKLHKAFAQLQEKHCAQKAVAQWLLEDETTALLYGPPLLAYGVRMARCREVFARYLGDSLASVEAGEPYDFAPMNNLVTDTSAMMATADQYLEAPTDQAAAARLYQTTTRFAAGYGDEGDPIDAQYAQRGHGGTRSTGPGGSGPGPKNELGRARTIVP